MSTTSPTTTEHSSAHYFLQGLVESGIEYLFCNLGTDHATLIEEMAKFKALGYPIPRLITCPHENVAIHMAGAYAAFTGKGQGVLVHVDAGTANAVMGMHNLMRSRLPVLLMAGRAPYTVRGELMGSRDNYVHFVQDPFDMASLVRPYTKWEYNLPSGVVSKEVLRRAHSVMHSDPPGPVFLSLPRETLAQHWQEDQVQSFSEHDYGSVHLGSSSLSQLNKVAQQLLAAENPMLVTCYAGRTARGFNALSALAELLGIRVYEASPTHNNISRDHSWFCGFDPSAAMADTDVGMLVDVDVPWLPKYVHPHVDTQWIHVDIDPIKKDFPLWGFASQTRIQANSAEWLEDLLTVVRPLITTEHQKRINARHQRVQALQDSRAQKLRHEVQLASQPGEVNPAFLMSTLNEMLDPQDVVVNEAIRHSPTLLNHLKRNTAKTLFSSAGGGLGYSGGMALGFKLANPKHRVVQIVGDGGFHFSTPTSVYAVAQAEGLPILTVVLDNGGWQAVKEATLRVHPDGYAAKAKDFHARLHGTHRQFEMVGAAFGAHAERVSEASELKGAIQRSLHALDQGQAVVMVVSIPKLYDGA
jgi:acetolactate synthase-1/2/3 large subunit